VRRRCESIGDLDIVVASGDPEPVMDAFCEMGSVREVIARGETKSSIRTTDGIQVDLRVVEPQHYGAALAYFTGSKAHNVRMRALALKQGLTLNEYGLAKLATDEEKEAEAGADEVGARGSVATVEIAAAPKSRATKRSRAIVAEEVMLPSATEEEVYSALGLSFIPPVQREDRGEIALAMKGKLPKLLELKSIRGDLHTHTDNSDGKNTIEEMAEAAVGRGYEYYNITDHSKSQGIITGIEGPAYRGQIARVRAAAKAIEKRHKGFRLLCGVEVNILPDGSSRRRRRHPRRPRPGGGLGALAVPSTPRPDDSTDLPSRGLPARRHPRPPHRAQGGGEGAIRRRPRGGLQGVSRRSHRGGDQRQPRTPGPQRRLRSAGPRAGPQDLDRLRRTPAR